MSIKISIQAGLTALAFSFLTTPLTAQEQPTEPQAAPAATQPERPRAINRFEDMTIRMLLEDVGTSFDVLQSENGPNRYNARTESGINFTAFPAACSEESGCVGLVVVAFFNDFETPNSSALDAHLHRYNDENASVKVYRSPSGQVVQQGYINAANAISYRNAQSQLVVFGRNVVRTSQSLAAFQNPE